MIYNEMKKYIAPLLLLLFLMLNTSVVAQDTTLSPIKFGLYEADSDSARYEVLYQTHVAALKAGVAVDYSGIDTLTIEVTKSSNRIPLGKTTDFKGLRLRVKNRSKLCYLFELQQEAKAITIDKSLLDGNDFSSVPELADGLYQLTIEDETPWVEKREGHNYPATRCDILLICDGQSRNNPIAPYNNEQSHPKCTFCSIDDDEPPIIIQNLTIQRDEANTYKVMPFLINHQHNLQIKNITLHTPESKLTADAAFDIRNCTNVSFENVTIFGTYSRKDYYGYGIMMNNVWNSRFVRLKAVANWGVFGTNNINTAELQDCDINRFDIHCYGRDVTMKNCRFSNLYNQFSSMYGTLTYKKCRFINFVPVLLEPSYNAYTNFNIYMEDCVFDATNSRYFLISAGNLNAKINSRPELTQKYWPKITIKNLTVNVPEDVSKVVIFYPKDKQEPGNSLRIGGFDINGMKFNYAGQNNTANLYLSSRYVKIDKAYSCKLRNLDMIPVTDAKITQATNKYNYPNSLYINLRHSEKDVIEVSKSRLNYNVDANKAYNITFDRCTVGMVRYSSAINATKRTYKNCNIYLNCGDDIFYYIDNHAVYDGSLFIPCDPKRQVGFTGTNNDVVFKNCRVQNRSGLLFKGSSDNREFKDFRLQGKR